MGDDTDGGVENGAALVHQHALPTVATDPDAPTMPVPVDLLQSMLDRINQCERDKESMMRRIQDQDNKLRALSAGTRAGQMPPFDPYAEIQRIPIRGANMGYNPIVTFGRMVWLTGIVALQLVDQDVEGQTEQALEHLTHLLRKAGTDSRHLVRVSVYLADIRTADSMYKAWNKHFEKLGLAEKDRPVRITHQATLKEPGFRVEVHAEAVLPARGEALQDGPWRGVA